MKKLLLALFVGFMLQTQAQCWKEAKSGTNSMGGIKSDGTLWTWGFNTYGVLGYTDPNVGENTPKQLGSDTDWEKIDFGELYMLVQKQNGTIWITGQFKQGPYLPEYPSMIQIGTDSDWKTFSCGKDFALFIKNDGTLWGMGNAGDGQLGLGMPEFQMYVDTPVQIGADNNWKAVAAGYSHSTALKSDGTLWTWGEMHWYDDWNEYIFEPVQVGTDSDWQTIDAGLRVNAALKPMEHYGYGEKMIWVSWESVLRYIRRNQYNREHPRGCM